MNSDDKKIKEVCAEQLRHDDTRSWIKGIVIDYINSVEFMQKVMQYAGQEIDARVFRSGRYWSSIMLTTVITTTLATVVTFLVTKYLL